MLKAPIVRFIVLVIFCLLLRDTAANTIHYKRLEREIYALNNRQQYTRSQQRLFQLLNKQGLTARDRYHVYILLSYTYKRLFDYQATLHYLDNAESAVAQLPNNHNELRFIDCQRAFALFDTQAYGKADQLMRRIEQHHYAGLDGEHRAKLLMQRAYLYFRNHAPVAADRCYRKAIRLMQRSSPCDLPMIYVKQMELAASLNDTVATNHYFRKAIQRAKACSILKYELYATEEFLVLLKNNPATAPQTILRTQSNLDSLKAMYREQEHALRLHYEREQQLQQQQNRALQRATTQSNYLWMVLTAGGALLAVAGYLFWRLRSNYKQLLVQYLHERESSSPAAVVEKTAYPELTERQREVLELVGQGFTNRQIAEKLFISENTVKFHIKNIYTLLNIKGRKRTLIAESGSSTT